MTTVHHGDCRDIMDGMAVDSIDAIVCDPPYGLKFMGKGWDHGVPGEEYWIKALRVAKPGAHLLAFGGTRMFHRLMVAIEDAGWEIRDTLGWIYGQGFPKSKNLDGDWKGWGTALKPAWEPIVVARKPMIGTVAANVAAYGTGAINIDGCRIPIDAAADASQLRTMNVSQHDGADGWGMNTTAPNSAARVLGSEGRWPANIAHDGSDEVIALFPSEAGAAAPVTVRNGDKFRNTFGAFGGDIDEAGSTFRGDSGSAARFFYCSKASRSDRNEGCEGVMTWESVDLNQEVKALLQHLKGISDSTTHLLSDSAWLMMLSGSDAMDQSPMGIRSIIATTTRLITEFRTSNYLVRSTTRGCILDATKTLLEDGLNLAESAECISRLRLNTTSAEMELARGAVVAVLKTLHKISELAKLGNVHSTVKPTELMRYLCRLVTPPGGLILDPFAGSGSTGKAAVIEGFRFVGIELEAEYAEIARARIEAVIPRQAGLEFAA